MLKMRQIRQQGSDLRNKRSEALGPCYRAKAADVRRTPRRSAFTRVGVIRASVLCEADVRLRQPSGALLRAPNRLLLSDQHVSLLIA